MNYQEYKVIKQSVLKRDEKKCQKCHSEHSLIVHHIIPVRFNGKDHPNNLVVLCTKCHKKVHRAMGSGMPHSNAHGFRAFKQLVNLDEDAHRILTEKRDQMKASGIRASLSDAVRALEENKKPNTGAWHGHNGPVIDDDHPRRPRGNAGGA